MAEPRGLRAELSRAGAGARILAGEETLPWVLDSWPRALWWTPSEVAARAPLAVAVPESEEQAAGLLAWAHAQGVGVVPRGGGSGVLGAAIPGPSSIVLDTQGLSKRFELLSDEKGPLVAAGAGTNGAALEERLNAAGFSLLHFPASLADSTVGGWVATASFGQLSSRYGGIERQAESVKVAYPGGELRRERPGLHVGAEGSLGVITEATLRVRPAPRSRTETALEFRGLASALAYARTLWLHPGEKPSVLRLYSPVDALASGLRGSGGEGVLSALKHRLEPLALRRYAGLNWLGRRVRDAWLLIAIYEDAAPPDFAALGRPGRIWEAPARVWWRRRYAWSLEKLKETVARRQCFADTMDFWAPWEDLPKLYRAVIEAVSPYGFVMAHISHFDEKGGCLYATAAGRAAGRAQTIGLHDQAWKAGMDAGARLGVRTNHHHGIGLAKRPWLASAADAGRVADLRREKVDRDPKGIMNPGKLCP